MRVDSQWKVRPIRIRRPEDLSKHGPWVKRNLKARSGVSEAEIAVRFVLVRTIKGTYEHLNEKCTTRNDHGKRSPLGRRCSPRSSAAVNVLLLRQDDGRVLPPLMRGSSRQA